MGQEKYSFSGINCKIELIADRKNKIELTSLLQSRYLLQSARNARRSGRLFGAGKAFARDNLWIHGTGNRFIQADPSEHIDRCVGGALWLRKR